MALPTLDATFASSADLPRKQMLAKWLVEELGETQAPSSVLVSGFGDYNNSNPNGIYLYEGIVNGKPSYRIYVPDFEESHLKDFSIQWSIGENAWILNGDYIGFGLSISYSNTSYPWDATWELYDGGNEVPTLAESPAPSPLSNYYSLPERYLWAKIAVAAGGPKTEADYISLPKNYVWSDIYNAVAGSSGNHTDWSENVALGHIAAAYRGDTGNPANLATYIDWPWRYKVASIIDHLMGNYNAVIVSGAGTASSNGTYIKQSGYQNGKPYYVYGGNEIVWSNSFWDIVDNDGLGGDISYQSSDDTSFPWDATFATLNGNEPSPTLTPTNV